MFFRFGGERSKNRSVGLVGNAEYGGWGTFRLLSDNAQSDTAVQLTQQITTEDGSTLAVRTDRTVRLRPVLVDVTVIAD